MMRRGLTNGCGSKVSAEAIGETDAARFPGVGGTANE